jgi:hypothetical protein
MNILYITPSFQHPEVRGPNRHYHFIRRLSERHAITLLTLARSEIKPEALAEMNAYTRDRLYLFDVNGGTDSKPMSRLDKLPFIGRRVKFHLGLRDMKRTFQNLLHQQKFDLVVFHGKSVVRVIEDFNELPIVVDFCDATSMRQRMEMQYAGFLRKPYLLLRYLRTRQAEKRLLAKTPHLAFISHRDRLATSGANPKARILPIGVDVNYWQRTQPDYQPNCIIFTGVMNYKPNHDAAIYLIEKILPILKQKISPLEVLIVGRHPKPALTELAKHNPQVTITGSVDDMRPYLERAAVLAAPLRVASGIQNKILEAMAMEVPVVTTPIVAEGLYLDGCGAPPLCQTNHDEEFVEHIITLLKNKDKRRELAKAGRRFVETNFSWSHSSEILENMCQEAVNNSGKNKYQE